MGRGGTRPYHPRRQVQGQGFAHGSPAAHRPLTTDYQLLPCATAPTPPVSSTPAKPLLHVPAPEKHSPTHFPDRQVLRPAVPVHRAYRHTQPVGHVGSAHHFIGPTLAGVSIMVVIF